MIASEESVERVKRTYGSTIHEILAKELEFDLFDILGAIQTLVGVKIFKKLPTSPGERMVFAFTWMAIEVRNGGFHQYFTNSAGDYWRDVLTGLAAIGDNEGLKSFRRALSVFPNSSPAESRDARLDQLESLEEQDEDGLWEHFKEASDLYFRAAYPKWDLVLDYVKAHSNQFNLAARN